MPSSVLGSSALRRHACIATVAFGALLSGLATACTSATSRVAPETSTVGPGSQEGSVPTSRAAVDWKAVDAAMGRPGIAQPGGVQRYNFPRGDLTVVVRDPRGDVTLRPALALAGWLAMHGTGAAATPPLRLRPIP